jgi:hypothetical protein
MNTSTFTSLSQWRCEFFDCPFGCAKAKRGQASLKASNCGQEEEAPKVEKLSKEFLAFVDAFHVFVVQQGEAIT